MDAPRPAPTSTRCIQAYCLTLVADHRSGKVVWGGEGRDAKTPPPLPHLGSHQTRAHTNGRGLENGRLSAH